MTDNLDDFPLLDRWVRSHFHAFKWLPEKNGWAVTGPYLFVTVETVRAWVESEKKSKTA